MQSSSKNGFEAVSITTIARCRLQKNIDRPDSKWPSIAFATW